MSDESSTAQMEQPTAQVPPQPPGPPGPATPEAEPPKKKGMSPWWWVLIVAVALVLLSGLFVPTSSSGGVGWLLALFGVRGTVTVPLVVGQTQSQATNIITGAGLRVGQTSQVSTLAVAPGLVVTQSPTGNSKAPKDSPVALGIAATPQVKVANVVGQTQSAASQNLAEQGLRVGSVAYTNSSSVSAGDLTAQDPAAGTEVAVGSAVNITVSKGKQQGQVPNVVGMSQSDAQSTLQGAGYKVTVVKASSSSVAAGDVSAQSPAAGTAVATGSTVTITVSTGAPATPKSTVPNLIGMSVINAFNALQNATLKMNIKFEASSENFLKVIAQDPGSGTSVDPGSVVTVTIGLPSFSFQKPSQQPTTPQQQPAPAPSPAPAPAPAPSPQPAPAPSPQPAPSPGTTGGGSAPTTP